MNTKDLNLAPILSRESELNDIERHFMTYMKYRISRYPGQVEEWEENRLNLIKYRLNIGG